MIQSRRAFRSGPRTAELNPRALKTNPRALGTNPRAKVRNKWAFRNWKRKHRTKP